MKVPYIIDYYSSAKKHKFPVMTFVQHDTEVNKITFNMYNGDDDSEPMTDMVEASFKVTRPDGNTYTFGTSECFEIAGNVVTLTLPAAAVYVAGDYSASVSVYDNNYGRLSTPVFPYAVTAELISDTPIDETNEYPILTGLITQAEQNLSDAEALKGFVSITTDDLTELKDTIAAAQYVNQAVYSGDEVTVDSTSVTFINAQLTEIMYYLSVAAASNIYTLDLSKNFNFVIETLDTVAKTISFSNIPITPANMVLSITVHLKFTNSATITFPAGTTWQNGISPIFNAGKKYILMFTSYDNGTTWLASYVGEW